MVGDLGDERDDLRADQFLIEPTALMIEHALRVFEIAISRRENFENR